MQRTFYKEMSQSNTFTIFETNSDKLWHNVLKKDLVLEPCHLFIKVFRKLFDVQIVGHIQSKMEVIVMKDGKELKLGTDINLNIRSSIFNSSSRFNILHRICLFNYTGGEGGSNSRSEN